MECRGKNVLEELIKLNKNKPLKNKELIHKIEKIKYNQKHSKIINLFLFILLEIILIILSRINRAFGLIIEIKVNKVGENQIISENYAGTLPKIYINNIDLGIRRIINIGNINDMIKLKWDTTISDFSYMFYNLENIYYFHLDYIPANNINITRMFYNCKNIATITFDISYNRNKNISESLRNKYYNPEDLSYAFYNCTSLTNLKLYYFRTYSTKEIKYMFFNCNKLTRNSFIDCNFANNLIENMRGIFQNCESLTSINLTTFRTPKVEIMWDMFKNCKSLSSLDLSTFDTSKVTDIESMFENCETLTSLSLDKFKTNNVHYMNKMFLGCTNLQNLHFNYLNSESLGTMDQMFCNCTSLKYLNLFSLAEEAIDFRNF